MCDLHQKSKSNSVYSAYVQVPIGEYSILRYEKLIITPQNIPF